eukprot:COSAG02_NODE_2445_length_8843_cov_21.333143_1_plen_724_part_00
MLPAQLTLLLLCSSPSSSSPQPVEVTIDISSVVNPRVSERCMGCHSDLGFAQTPSFFSANLLHEPAFGFGTRSCAVDDPRLGKAMSVPPWFTRDLNGTIGAVTRHWACPTTTDSVLLQNGSAVVNRGVGGVGLSLETGLQYELEVYARIHVDGGARTSPAIFVAELRDSRRGTVLARSAVDLSSFDSRVFRHRLNVTLTPSQSTECVRIANGSDPLVECGAAHTDRSQTPIRGMGGYCLNCGGELSLSIIGGATIYLGHASLMPPPSHRVTAQDGTVLPVLKRAAELVSKMGIKLIRSGGSFAKSIRWKDWRGEAWNRPSSRHVHHWSSIGGFGPFEHIAFCNAVGVEPVLTIAGNTNSAEDFADLVEYCYGGSDTTWGAQRIRDGHPGTHNLTFIECGNEEVNLDFNFQVQAMELRAARLRASGAAVPPLYYINPWAGGMSATDAQQAVDMQLPIERLLTDVHVQAGGGVARAKSHFDNPPIPGFNNGMVVMETNAGTHDVARGLAEATDLIEWFAAAPNISERMLGRAASFCAGSVTQNDGSNFDQAIAWWLPNNTLILQPPGHVHSGFAQTWASATVRSVVIAGDSHGNASDPKLPFVAHTHRSEGAGASALVLRAVNHFNVSRRVLVRLLGVAPLLRPGDSKRTWTLAPPPGCDATTTRGGEPDGQSTSGSLACLSMGNVPTAPTAVSPVVTHGEVMAHNELMMGLPPFSVVVVNVTLL